MQYLLFTLIILLSFSPIKAQSFVNLMVPEFHEIEDLEQKSLDKVLLKDRVSKRESTYQFKNGKLESAELILKQFTLAFINFTYREDKMIYREIQKVDPKNIKRRLIKSIEYYDYTDEGLLQRARYYNDQMELQGQARISYDTLNRPIKVERSDAFQSAKNLEVASYEEGKNMVLVQLFDDDGDMYNALLLPSDYESKENLKDYLIWNKQGDVVFKKKDWSLMDYSFYEFMYRYDRNGNWKVKKKFLVELDENGNVIHSELVENLKRKIYFHKN